jgi:prepilin-type N-terminal cleavage/methylation domain-containing protein
MKKAFTLIELLIVVAIIAILAAIAVPNFLEAQTRSKVSRSKADIRSMATAVESYFVDNNNYPPSAINPLQQRTWRLTTPIAYMTTIPFDVFNPGEDDVSVPFGENDIITLGTLNNDATNPGPNIILPSGTFTAYFANGALDIYALQVGRDPESMRWILFSYGPAQNPLDHPDYLGHPSTFGPTYPITVGYLEIVYDPTNGTVSEGIVPRLGP